MVVDSPPSGSLAGDSREKALALSVRESVLYDGLEEVLDLYVQERLAVFDSHVQSVLKRSKRLELIRARVLEAITDVPVYAPESIVEIVLQLLPEAFGCDRVNYSVYLGGDDTREFQRATDGALREGKVFRNKYCDFANPVFAEAVQKRELIFGRVPDSKRIHARYRTAAYLVVPLVVKGRTLGVFSFADKVTDDDYGHMDAEEVRRFVATLGHTLTDKVEKSRDGLTGLLNRIHFIKALGGLLEDCYRDNGAVSLFYMDLDHFKRVNDTHGHGAGDDVLRAFSDVLRGCVRHEGSQTDLVARMGGEEFCIALPLREDGARARGDLIVNRVRSEDFPVVGNVTASVGVATFQSNGAVECDVERLIRHADQAMYHRKQNGRNGVCFFSDL